MKEYVLKFVDPQVTIQEESKEDFKKLMGWDEYTFMSKVFVRLSKDAESKNTKLSEKNQEKIVLAIYNGKPHTRDNISHYRNPRSGEKFDVAPEGYKIIYDDVLSEQCNHPNGERDIDGQCNCCGKFVDQKEEVVKR